MLRTLYDRLSDLARPRREARRAPREVPHYWINPDGALMRAAWMREQLGAGYSVLETTLGRLGEEINEVNDAFDEEVQPVIDNLTKAIGEVDAGLGDLGDTVGDVIIPLQEFEKSIIAVTGGPSPRSRL